jgi:hypothetical protein
VLVSDLGSATSELAKTQGDSYPGGSQQAWERWQAEQARQKAAEAAPRRSNREAIARFGGEAA